MSITENPNGVTDANGETIEETVKSPEAVLKKNKELLSKLKAEQERNRENAEKLEALEQEKLAQAGKKDELIEALKKQVKEKDEKAKSLTQTFALKSVNTQVLEAARLMGCERPDVVMKLADLSEVTVGEDFSVDQEALKLALGKVRDEVPTLFKKAPVAPKDGTPTNQVEGTKPLHQMSVKELSDLYLKKALSQKG